MWVYVFKKLITLITIMFATTFIAFMILYWFASFDPLLDKAIRGDSSYPYEVILYQLRELFGHNGHIIIRYVRYMAGIFTGDFGRSFSNNLPIAPLVMPSLLYTLQLGGIALVISMVMAFSLTIFTMLRKSTLTRKVLIFITQIGSSMPVFVTAIFLIILFLQTTWERIPSFNDGELILLPIIILSANMFFEITRTVQTSFLNIAGIDNVGASPSKGLAEKRVVCKHVLRNALVPTLSALQTHLGGFLAGIIMIESLLGLPGIGRITVQSAWGADYPLLLGCFVMIVFCGALLSSLVDIFRTLILVEQ